MIYFLLFDLIRKNRALEAKKMFLMFFSNFIASVLCKSNSLQFFRV